MLSCFSQLIVNEAYDFITNICVANGKTIRILGIELTVDIAGVDLMRSERGPLVLEVNASPGFGIEKITGRNVAGKIIDYVEHNASRHPRKDRVGA